MGYQRPLDKRMVNNQQQQRNPIKVKLLYSTHYRRLRQYNPLYRLYPGAIVCPLYLFCDKTNTYIYINELHKVFYNNYSNEKKRKKITKQNVT